MRKNRPLFLVLFCGLLGCKTGPPDWRVVIDPFFPQQGDTIKIIVASADRLGEVDGIFLGREIHFFPLGPNEARALIGLGAEVTEGDSELRIIEKREFKGNRGWKQIVSIKNKSFPTESIHVSEKMRRLMKDPRYKESQEKFAKAFSTLTSEQLWEGLFSQPLRGRLTTPYGVRRLVESTPFSYHKGWDIAAPRRRVVNAANHGRVLLAESFPMEGRTVVLDHGQGVLTAYLHLSAIEVEKGAQMRKDQLIGRVGSDGFSTGPHLHWGVYVHGEPVDPASWLKKDF